MNIAVVGAGHFGTAIAEHIAQNGYNVKLYTSSKEKYDDIVSKGVNKEVYKGYYLSTNIQCEYNVNETISDSDAIFVAVSTNYIGGIYSQIYKYIKKTACVINLSKGVSVKDFLFSYQIFKNIFGSKDNYVTLSGPNFAIEILKQKPTTTLISSSNEKHLQNVKKILQSDYFRIYLSNDVIGSEVCGMMKNIMAIASGINHELDFGWNGKSAIISRGLHEIIKMIHCFGGNEKTALSVAGIGDLIGTTGSPLSRNYQCGILLAQGMPLDKIEKKIGSTVEGIYNIEVAKKLIDKYSLDMPITVTLYEVIFKKKSLEIAVKELMTR